MFILNNVSENSNYDILYFNYYFHGTHYVEIFNTDVVWRVLQVVRLHSSVALPVLRRDRPVSFRVGTPKVGKVWSVKFSEDVPVVFLLILDREDTEEEVLIKPTDRLRLSLCQNSWAGASGRVSQRASCSAPYAQHV